MLNRVHAAALLFLAAALTQSQAAPTNEFRTIHLVSRIVGKDFLSETIRIGDLNGDGAPDILFVQKSLYGPRIITCLTATTLSGEVLWQTGTPSKESGRAYCDLPVQIYDWDGDGTNEALCPSGHLPGLPAADRSERSRARAALRRQRDDARAGWPHGKREDSFPSARASG